MGKPSDALLHQLGCSYAVDLPHALMVGDTLATDIVFGNRGGMQTLLVLSGVTTQQECEDALSGGDAARQPSFVLPMLGSLADQIDAEEAAAAAAASLDGTPLI